MTTVPQSQFPTLNPSQQDWAAPVASPGVTFIIKELFAPMELPAARELHKETLGGALPHCPYAQHCSDGTGKGVLRSLS